MKKMLVNIPSGIIKKVTDIITEHNLTAVVYDATMRRNIAYTFQFINFVDWLLSETDLGLTVKKQVIKYGIVALNSIMEGVIYDYLKRNQKVPKKGTGKNIDKLVIDLNMPTGIANSLIAIHRKREKIHLNLCGGSLDQEYDLKGYNDVKTNLMDFIKWISKMKANKTVSSS